MENIFEKIAAITKPVKAEKHSFKPLRDGSLAYCEYGSYKPYCNITQAEKKVIELQSLGYNVYRRYQHPFYIILNN